jgi:hypothetical protein
VCVRLILGYIAGIQFGAGGATAAAELKAEGTRDPNWAIAQAKRFLEAGAEIIMIESEGITENVDSWRTDVPAKFIDAIGMEKLMFEAAGSGCVRVVHQKLRRRRKPFCRSQPNRATGVFARRHLGNKEFVGKGSGVQRHLDKTRVILSESKDLSLEDESHKLLSVTTAPIERFLALLGMTISARI